MRWYWGIALDTLDLANKDVPSDTKTYIKLRLVEIYRAILVFEIKSICSYYRNRGFSFLRDLVKFDDWESQLENICKLENEFERDYHQYSSQQTINLNSMIQGSLERLMDLISENKESQLGELDRQCLKDLHVTDPKHDKSRIIESKEDLQWEFLSWVFKNSQFQEWRDNDSSRLLWIKGDPGKGKTMLICGILQELENSLPFQHCLAYFFCQGTDQRLNNANNVLRGLIYMLVLQRHSLLSHVRKEYNSGGSSTFNDANSWIVLSNIFENILQDPGSRGCYVVIDALDECAADRKKLLDLIVKNLSNTPRIKWVLSSRNFVDIENKLDACSSSFRIDLEINAETVSGAVNAYIQNKIPNLGLLKNREHLHDQMCSEMLEKANGTFLWAALVFKEFERLEDFIPETDDQVLALLRNIPSDLTELYHRMLKQVLDITEDVFENRKRCIDILSTMAVAFQPIQLIELSPLIGYKNKGLGGIQMFKKLVQKCGSFLTIRGDTVYFIHQTAKDYLVEAGSDQLFENGIGAVHRAVFHHSLDVLSSSGTLRRNIYDLPHPSVNVSEIVRPCPDPLQTIRYSCVHAFEHFSRSLVNNNGTSHSNETNDVHDIKKIHKFLKQFLLNWLEAICLMREFRRNMASMHRIVELLELSFKKRQRDLRKLSEFDLINDAFRFMFFNRYFIFAVPLQTYVSALMFSPMKSAVRLQFQEELSWIKTLPVVDEHWDSCKYTFFCIWKEFCNYAISNDGKFVAAACSDGRIQVWELSTGNLFCATQVGNKPTISIESSSGSILLASKSSSGFKVMALSTCSKKEIWSSQTFSQEYDDHHIRLLLSEDSALIALIVGNGLDHIIVHIIDSTTGQDVKRLYLDERCYYIQLSPDFKLIAEWQTGGSLRIRNTYTEETLYEMKDIDKKTRIGLSSRLNFLAIQDESGKLSVRNIVSNTEIMRIPYMPYLFLWSSFSDSILIANHDGVVQAWDITTGKSDTMALPFDVPRNDGKDDYKRCFYFSENCRFLIYFGRYDIKLWELDSMNVLEHTQTEITSLALSNDAKLIASSSKPPRSISILDSDTGEVRHTLIHQGDFDSCTHRFCEMAFSNDARILITCLSINEDGIECLYTVSLWSTETGNKLLSWNVTRATTGVDCSDSVRSLELSPDSTLLAMEFQSAVILWDVKTGRRLHTLKNSENRNPRQMSFSADCKFLALSGESAKKWGTVDVELWNLSENKVIWHFNKTSEAADVFFDNSTLCVATDQGYIGFDALDMKMPTSSPLILDIEQLDKTGQPQPVSARLYNERYSASHESTAFITAIYWNAKRLIWVHPQYRYGFYYDKCLSTRVFASSSSVIKIRSPNRGILTIEFQRPPPDASDDWTPWQSSLLFQGNRSSKQEIEGDKRHFRE